MADDWRSAYADRAAFQQASINAMNSKRKKAAELISQEDDSGAKAAFRKGFEYLGQSEPTASKKEDGDSFIQRAIDVLSTGTYMGASLGDQIIQSVKAGNEGGVGAGIGKFVETTFSPDNPVIRGVRAGIGGDNEAKVTNADNIYEIQKMMGEDPTSDASRQVQGAFGLLGDIVIDPTWFLPAVPGAKLVGKGVTGFVEGGARAKNIAKEAVEKAGDQVASPIRAIAENPKGRFGTAIDYMKLANEDWKTAQAAIKEAKRIKASGEEAPLTADISQVGGAAQRVGKSEEEAAKENARLAKEAEARDAALAKENADAQAKFEQEVADNADAAKPAATVLDDFINNADELKAAEAERTAAEKAAKEATSPVGVKTAEAPKPSKNIEEAAAKNDAGVSVTSESIAAKSLPKIDAINNAAYKALDEMEPLFQAPFYNPRGKGKKVIDAVSQPATITREIPRKAPEPAPAKAPERAAEQPGTGAETAPQTADGPRAPETAEEFLNNPDLYAKLDDFITKNPEHRLKDVKDLGNGKTKPIARKLENLRTMIDTFLEEGKYGKSIEDLYSKNRDFFDGFVEGAAKTDVKSAEAGLKAAPSAAKEITPEKAAANDVLDDFLTPAEMEEIANPNAWSPEIAQKLFKEGLLDEAHVGMTAEEILKTVKPMTNAQIKKYIMDMGENGLTRENFKKLQLITGKTDRAEVADQVILLRKLREKDRAAAAKIAANPKLAEKTAAPETPAAAIKETEAAAPPVEKPRKGTPATPEEIAAVDLNQSNLADEFLKSPQALREAVQHEYRMRRFEELRKEPIPADSPIATATTKAEVNAAAQAGVQKAMEFQLKEAPLKTDGGFRTMSEGIDEGGAWRPDFWGTNSQIAMHTEIRNFARSVARKEAAQRAAAKGKNYAPNPVVEYRAYMETLRVADAQLRAMGIEPFMNHVSKKIVGKSGKAANVNASWYDVLSALERAELSGTARKILSGQKTSYLPTQIQGAVETLFRMRADGASDSLIKSRMLEQLRSGAKAKEYGAPVKNAGAGDLRNKEAVDAIAKYAHPTDAAAARRALDEDVVNSLMDAGFYNELRTQMTVNMAQHSAKLASKAKELTQEIVTDLNNLVGKSQGEALSYLANKYKLLKGNFAEADIQTMKELLDSELKKIIGESHMQTMKVVEARVPKDAKKAQKKVQDSAKNLDADGKPKPGSSPESKASREKVAAGQVQEAKIAAEQAAKDAPEGAEEFLQVNAAISIDALRKIHPVQAFFNPRLGLSAEAFRAMNSGLHSIARQQNEFHSSIMPFLAKYGDAQLNSDFKAIREAVADPRNSPHGFFDPSAAGLSNSAQELYGTISVVFDTSLANVWSRNGIGAAHFNSLAKANGIPEKWHFDPGASADAAEAGYINSQKWATEWEGIEEHGILDFLSKMHAVAIKASQDVAIASSFAEKFGSKTAKPGYAKIHLTNRIVDNDPVFFDLLPKDMYYPKDILTEIHIVERMLRESRHINPKNAFGKFIVNVFDPVTNALKASQTTVRPGHWMITSVGNLLQNHLAGVNTFKPYQRAGRILMTGRKMANSEEDLFHNALSHGKAINQYKNSQEINRGFTATGGGNDMKFVIAGKQRPISDESLYKMMKDVVMIPPHRGGGVMEDRFIENNPTAKFARMIEKGTDFVTDNKAFSLNRAAAFRDNHARIALALDYASKRSWKSVEDMKKGMEDIVTKWYPTSTDFTAAEAKYARRTLLYYTWLRGITPRVIDAAMTKPGVATMIPKALYNTAYANGLNPESIGEPFPDDHLFPDYYKNNVLGPQWKTDDGGMWGLNPSSPLIEVANTFNRVDPTDPLGTIGGVGSQLLGMATPFARMPVEMGTGTQAGSGIPIKDTNQYLLDNLGGSWIGAASRASGKTIGPDGSLIDRTDSAAKPYEEDQKKHAALQLINFLSGAKFTDYNSTPSQKAAGYSATEKIRKQAELDARR